MQESREAFQEWPMCGWDYLQRTNSTGPSPTIENVSETTSRDGYPCLCALKILTETATPYLPFTTLSHVNQLAASFDPANVESRRRICRPVAAT
jgi:hypothetical protein